MRVKATLCSYASRYSKLYNEISGGNEKIAASTFRMGLSEDSKLPKSLTKKPLEDMRQLTRRIEEYKRMEDDRLQSKGKALLINHPRQSGFQPRPQKDLRIQEPKWQVGEVNVTFKEPVHRIIDRIKNEPYFRWPNKMGGDPSRRNQNLYCTYHKDNGHTTEQCRVLKDHLGQLVKVRHLKEFVVNPGERGTGQEDPPNKRPSEKKAKHAQETLAFDEEELKGTIQPHDDMLVVTARDLTKYDTLLVSFDGRVVIPEGQISFPVSMRGKEVMVTFIVVSSFSFYMAILGRLWIQAMGAVSSTLHVKVKFPTKQGVVVVRGSQQVARQCLVAAISWKGKQAEQKETTKKASL
nr:uncharacterized protein LOC111985496 [Quercus suber]